MVPTQDVTLRAAELSAIEYLPAAVVAVVVLVFALSLVLVALRRRDAD